MNNIERIVLKLLNNKDEMQIEFRANNKGSLPKFIYPKLSNIEYIEYFCSNEERGKIEDKNEIEKLINSWIDTGLLSVETNNFIIPKISYSDITEKCIIGSQEISQENLSSKEHGIWAKSGLRKILIRNLPEIIEGKKYIYLNFKKINEEECNDDNLMMEKSDCSKNTAVAILDTDYLGLKFDKEYSQRKYLQFNGDIEYVCEAKNNTQIVFKFPICITLRNTNKGSDILSEKYVSIDFGTSSTCVAVKSVKGPELLTLSISDDEDNESENKYENPTNIMLFNWDSLYEQWREENKFAPLIFKGKESDITAGQRVDYNFGYEVKNLLEEAKKEELNAILTLIKMVHYNIANGMQMDINPFLQNEKYVYIVSSPKEQDETHLDPVAFYGYLIGKAVNDPSKRECIYNKFKITCPVKFNEDIKEKLRVSLEYGLKRSIPKDFKDSCIVSMDIEEPVAYIGAMCGTKYFSIDDGESKNFAVYDFGGGTLDFSYGTASNDDDELTIKIVGVGGDENIGGEKLIERISFWIYKNNLTNMVQNNIPIIKPTIEKLPDGLPEKLIAHSNLAYANTNRINELISRKIFEDRQLQESPMDLELFDENGDEIGLSLAYDIEDITISLEDIIEDTVKRFAVEMDSAFSNTEGYSKNDVWIFKAGNSSKNEFVETHMYKIFENNNKIQMVDQIEDKTQEYKRYAITPKTAVAFGQLNLSNVNLIRDKLLFKYYIGFINAGTGAFRTIINKNSSDTSWKKFRKIKNDEVEIYYTESESDENAQRYSKSIKTSVYIGRNLYIRILDDTTIECGVDNADGDDVDIIAKINLERKE